MPSLRWASRPRAVSTWCRQNGLDSPVLLANAFASYEEAVTQGSNDLASVWEWCSAHHQYPMQVHWCKWDATLSQGTKRGPNGTEGYGLANVWNKLPKRAGLKIARPGKRARYNPRKTTMATDTGTKSEFCARIAAATEAADLSISWRPQAGVAAGMGNVPELLNEIRNRTIKELTNTEPITIHRAVAAWKEWCAFANVHNADPLGPYPAALLGCWVNKEGCKTGPLNRFYKSNWLRTNLAAPMDLANIAKPRATAGSLANAKQAVVAEPAMLRAIEVKIADHTTDERVVPALCVAHVLATSVLRFRHAQRSTFMQIKKTGYWCKCALGKVRNDTGARAAFYWFAPQVQIGTDTTHVQVTEKLYNLWATMSVRVGHTLPYMAFDGRTGRKLSLPQFHTILREELSDIVSEDQIQWITSYSFRRVGATATKTIALDPLKEFIFGGWTATKATTHNAELRKSMPTRYNGRRAEQEEKTKVAVWATISQLLKLAEAYGGADTWDSIEQAGVRLLPNVRKMSLDQLLTECLADAGNQAEDASIRPAFGNHDNEVQTRRFSIVTARKGKCTPGHIPIASMPPEQAPVRRNSKRAIPRVRVDHMVSETGNAAKQPIPPIHRCAKTCTICMHNRRRRGLPMAVCWLAHDHNRGMSSDHACRECWVDFPIDIKSVRDARGYPEFPANGHKPCGVTHSENVPTRPCTILDGMPGQVAAHKPGLASCRKKQQTMAEVTKWVVARTTEGTWAKVVHAVGRTPGADAKAVACKISLPGRGVHTYTSISQIPQGLRICTRCFDNMDGNLWGAVCKHRPSALPLSRRRILDTLCPIGDI